MKVEYQGELLFEAVASVGRKTYSLRLLPQTRIGALRRFITSELMTGTRYRGIAEKQLATAICAALAHPSLIYVEYNKYKPMWREVIEFFNKRTRNKAKPTQATVQEVAARSKRKLSGGTW